MRIISNFQRRQTFKFIRLYWNIIKCEKLILSLNILVDEQLLVAFMLWVLITDVRNGAQMYYQTKPFIAEDSEIK